MAFLQNLCVFATLYTGNCIILTCINCSGGLFIVLSHRRGQCMLFMRDSNSEVRYNTIMLVEYCRFW